VNAMIILLKPTEPKGLSDAIQKKVQYEIGKEKLGSMAT